MLVGVSTKRVTLQDVLSIPYDEAIKVSAEFARKVLEESGAKGFVLGLSGGLDSSALLAVLSRAVAPEDITALIMPDSRATPSEDVEDAVELARMFRVRYYVVYIDTIVDAYKVAPFVEVAEDMSTGNLRARIRMNLLYYYANKYGALVAGSSDRSELLIGYYTKYGDGAADLMPLGCFYKTQVREIARRLGIPEKIVYKPSAPRLFRGHTAKDELGYTYEEIDLVLYALFDLKLSVEEAAEATGLPRKLIEKVVEMHKKSKHKRLTLRVPQLPWLPQPLQEL